MYRAIDVARHIVNYSLESGLGITNLKLQKILYLTQGTFIANGNINGCFSDKIEAWALGPVVPDVYREFKRYAAGTIPEIKTYMIPTNRVWLPKIIKYNDIVQGSDKELIDWTVDKYKDYTASQLIAETHKQKPWKDNYKKGENKVIPLDSIRSYFNEHADEYRFKETG